MTLADLDQHRAARRGGGTPEPYGPTLEEIREWPATVSVPFGCSALGISTSWGYQLIAAGEFPARTITIRGRARVVTASLIALLESA